MLQIRSGKHCKATGGGEREFSEKHLVSALRHLLSEALVP